MEFSKAIAYFKWLIQQIFEAARLLWSLGMVVIGIQGLSVVVE